MNLERIIQMENESVEDFIKRAIEEVKNTLVKLIKLNLLQQDIKI